MTTRILTTAGLLLSSIFCLVSARAHSAVEAAPRTDQGWQDRHKLLNTRAAEGGERAQVVFIGDSITQGWEGAGKEVWEKYYTRRNAVNLGIGGDRTQHVLWRLDNGNLTGLKPKAAVVMIGTNNSNGEDNTIEQIAEGVTAIVASLQAKLPDTKVVLLGIFPRSENPAPQRGKLLQINQILQRLGDNQRVFYVDFGYKFIGADGLIPRNLMPDYLHLSPEAYGIWAASIEGLLSHLIGDTAVPATATGGDLTGEWIWTIRGPDGNPVEAPLILKQEGGRVTGRFSRGPDRWLEIENGKVTGGDFTWTVKRDRPDGGTMTYEMSGALRENHITGKVRTTMDGNETLADWSAKRK
jgi:lysophospholipase L1-like esterase